MTTLLAMLLALAVIAMVAQYLLARRVVVHYAVATAVLTVRRYGVRHVMTVAGMVGDVIMDVDSSGAVVGVAITATDRFRGRAARQLDLHRDRKRVPRALWNEMRVFLANQRAQSPLGEQIAAAMKHRAPMIASGSNSSDTRH